MYGVDLNKNIQYLHASLRFFKENEYHISRLCNDDVLLLVYDGILRFTEDGVPYEIRPGQYHIQRHGSMQTGDLPSTAPKYLYVHFRAEWTPHGDVLPRSGTFDYAQLQPLIKKIDALSKDSAPYVFQAGKFYELLTKLHRKEAPDSLARRVAEYLEREYSRDVRLEQLCEEFHFSKNHIINTFKKEFSVTPVVYLNNIRLKAAEYMIAVTSDSFEGIARRCGYQNYPYFYRQFVRKNKMSPKEFRTKKRIGIL